MSVSIVIPAHNAAPFIVRTLGEILANSCVSEVLVVDDGSTDATPDLVRDVARRDSRVILIRAEANRGAGVARNIGFAAVRGEYTMFLDCDDFLAPGAIDEVHTALAASTADFAVYRYKFCRTGEADATLMHPADQRFWDGVPADRLTTQAAAAQMPTLFVTVNFPWTKMARTAFLRRVAVRFSESFVFNDMLGHWMHYLGAGDVLLYNKPLLYHRVDDGGRPQLTTTSDRRKLEVFTAFDDVEALFARDPAHMRHYHLFLFYKLEVLIVVARELAPHLATEFVEAVKMSYRAYDAAKHAHVSAVMPDVARLSMQAKNDPRAALPVPPEPDASGGVVAGADFQSKTYWQARYVQGGNSGAGSHGRLADFKAAFINGFVKDKAIGSVIEFGCGDGDQLAKFDLPSYVGVDVSEFIVSRCRERFAQAADRRFVTYDELHAVRTADLALSLDVIFHLVEDDVFERYMNTLFAFGRRYVVIYSSNRDASWPDRHVRHRHVTRHVETFFPEWTLAAHVPNAFPYDPAAPDTTSFADFFVFANPWTAGATPAPAQLASLH